MWDAEAMNDVLVEGKTYMVIAISSPFLILKLIALFQVTNLMPQLPSGWNREQIFLFTRRDTRWRRVALPKPAVDRA